MIALVVLAIFILFVYNAIVTGKERCENFRVQREQRNQCGDTR